MTTLDIKYRPKTFQDFIGNADTIEAIQNNINSVHTYLFYGPRGCGKTTLARIIAKEVGANEHSIYEMNIADVGLKDTAREIAKNAKYVPLLSKAKVFILDEIQESSSGFQEALLKITEEPAASTYFILCTTDPQKLKQTILSRCTQLKVNTLRRPEIMKLLTRVAEKENLPVNKNLFKKISDKVGGCPREALILLGKIGNIADEEIVNNLIESNLSFSIDVQTKDLCDLLLNNASWDDVRKCLKKIKTEPESIRRGIIGYLSAIMLNSKQDKAVELHEIVEVFLEGNYIRNGRGNLISDCFILSSRN